MVVELSGRSSGFVSETAGSEVVVFAVSETSERSAGTMGKDCVTGSTAMSDIRSTVVFDESSAGFGCAEESGRGKMLCRAVFDDIDMGFGGGSGDVDRASCLYALLSTSVTSKADLHTSSAAGGDGEMTVSTINAEPGRDARTRARDCVWLSATMTGKHSPVVSARRGAGSVCAGRSCGGDIPSTTSSNEIDLRSGNGSDEEAIPTYETSRGSALCSALTMDEGELHSGSTADGDTASSACTEVGGESDMPSMGVSKENCFDLRGRCVVCGCCTSATEEVGAILDSTESSDDTKLSARLSFEGDR